MADMNGDGVDDAFEATGRTAMMVAMQLGEKFGRLREDLARQAAARDDAAARALAARFEAERGAARAELRVVDQPEWWDRATPQDVARVIETAETWKGLDDVAKHASERIETEVRGRYGIDVNEFRSTAATEHVRADQEVTEAAILLDQADRLDRDAHQDDRGGDRQSDDRGDLVRELEERASEYERRADAGGDATNSPEELRELATDARSQAQLYRDMDEATQSVRAQEAAGQQPAPAQAEANRSEAGVVYDSAERRRDTAQRMEQAGVSQEDVRIRSRVDADQGRPAAEAVAAGAHAGTRKAQTPQGRSPQRVDRTR